MTVGKAFSLPSAPPQRGIGFQPVVSAKTGWKPIPRTAYPTDCLSHGLPIPRWFEIAIAYTSLATKTQS
jgi:hypothetical protein